MSLAADQAPNFQMNNESAIDKKAIDIESKVVTSKDFTRLEIERKNEMAEQN